MLGAFCAGGNTRQDAVWAGREETNPFDGPAEDGCLEVFRVCKLATLEDSD